MGSFQSVGNAMRMGKLARGGLPAVGALCALCRKNADYVSIAQSAEDTRGYLVEVRCHGKREVVTVPDPHGSSVTVVAFSEEAKRQAARVTARVHSWRGRGRRSAVRNRWRFEA